MKKFTKQIAALLVCASAAGAIYMYKAADTSYVGGMMPPDSDISTTPETTIPYAGGLMPPDPEECTIPATAAPTDEIRTGTEPVTTSSAEDARDTAATAATLSDEYAQITLTDD